MARAKQKLDISEVYITPYIKYKIEIIPKLTAPDSKGCDGICVHDQKLIQVLSTLPLEEQKSTLCHEIMHAILYVSGHTEFMTEEAEEALVLAFEFIAYPLIKDLIGKGVL